MTHKKWIPTAMVIADKHAKSDFILGSTHYTRCVLEIARALEAAADAAKEQERERCAKVAEQFWLWSKVQSQQDVCRLFAAAIRKGTE